MKLFNSFLLSVASADESRGACYSLIREKLTEYPIVGGKWDCSRLGKDNIRCDVICDGAGKIFEFKWNGELKQRKNELIPFIRASDCSGDEFGRFKTKWLKNFNVENPIECLDFTAGGCENKAKEVLDRQKEIKNGSWKCALNERSRQFSCSFRCNKRKYQTPSFGLPEFRFSHCHTKNPEFKSSLNGAEFECFSCDQKIDELSTKIENGSFIKLDSRNRREITYHGGGGGGNGGGGENFSTFYELRCDDGRVEAKYRCYNR